MVKREELVDCIHSDEHEWSCPTSDGNCEFGDCRVCASIVLEEYEQKIRAEERAKILEEVKNKVVSFHADMIFRYGMNIVEARADAFDELKEWLKEQKNE